MTDTDGVNCDFDMEGLRDYGGLPLFCKASECMLASQVPVNPTPPLGEPCENEDSCERGQIVFTAAE